MWSGREESARAALRCLDCLHMLLLCDEPVVLNLHRAGRTGALNATAKGDWAAADARRNITSTAVFIMSETAR